MGDPAALNNPYRLHNVSASLQGGAIQNSGGSWFEQSMNSVADTNYMAAGSHPNFEAPGGVVAAYGGMVAAIPMAGALGTSGAGTAVSSGLSSLTALLYNYGSRFLESGQRLLYQSALAGQNMWGRFKDVFRRGGNIIDPKKFNYLFGQGTGRVHNIDRSIQNLIQLRRIGVYNNIQGRALLQSHFQSVARNSNNVLRTFTNQWGTFQVKESLFSGPGGFLKFESTWQVLENGALRFNTAIPFGGP